MSFIMMVLDVNMSAITEALELSVGIRWGYIFARLGRSRTPVTHVAPPTYSLQTLSKHCWFYVQQLRHLNWSHPDIKIERSK